MIPDNHNHDGTPLGGKKISVRNLTDYERYLFIPAIEFEETDANAAIAQLSNHAVMVFTDAATGVSTLSFMVPSTKRSISKIQVVYFNQNNNSNLYLTFATERAREGVANVTDASTIAAYATGATDNVLDYIDVPKSAYDGLLQLNPFDIIGFKITRTAGDAADTYNADWKVYGLLVEFS